MRILCKLVLLLVVIFTVSCSKKENPVSVSLNVMSFNIWVGGGKSIGATAEVFVNSGADIIGVQEASRDDRNIAEYIADSLGWHSYVYDRSPTIISKYPIIDTSANKHGVKIKIDESHYVWMFNVHLIHCPYEPYQLNGIEYCGAPSLSTENEAIESARQSREKDVKSNISDILSVQKEGYPVFLTGDFNEPSCLDWTSEAVEAKLCKIAVKWPSTKAFIDSAGMKDSYRILYPDEVKNPGYTWTPLPETTAYTEVLDRIDFVFFWGNNIELKNSQVLGEESPESDIKFNNYPSDHRAVLSSFIIK
ncbi:endonuclease/exonuclease/phosphatase family protein [Dysgonomonas sp. Marseille-P4677]|uniref:endonuclease/exonuclease/phosphatase family protein n=1 Tax=Dysgonomonas sp. Marseille-P4677 TaxID=2364790 RepID=UPI001914D252|nr:endonuclease/exonuclease/phosphatase family protein [Dysgonomonas sp. Marseille-P4677]MBK5721126.1 endonuclease/exonuclease/phosphatase family protein [Dysgonomonas sp. Marseille-P4677]